MDFKVLSHNLLRIVTGLMFWQHGAQKLFGMFEGNQVESWLSFPMGIAGILEFFGGILILLGVKTRWVAFLLCGQMAYAYFTVHQPRAFMPGVRPWISRAADRTFFWYISSHCSVVADSQVANSAVP